MINADIFDGAVLLHTSPLLLERKRKWWKPPFPIDQKRGKHNNTRKTNLV